MNDTTFQGNGKIAYVPVVVNAKPPKPTNYDRIRAKSVEEMAEFLGSIIHDYGQGTAEIEGAGYVITDWLDWLKREVEDAETLS